MELNEMLLPGLLLVFFGLALLRIFRTPLKLALRLLSNTLLGFLALFVTGLTTPWTGIALGLNLWNALIIGVFGLPGFLLLLLTEWVL